MSDPESTVNGDDDSGEAASLDHTLLESLFYNEMMLLDESSFLSPEFLGTLTGENPSGFLNQAQSLSQSQSGHPQNECRINVVEEKNASAFTERDLLQDFGVPPRLSCPVTTAESGGNCRTSPAVVASAGASSPSTFNGTVVVQSGSQQHYKTTAKSPDIPKLPEERVEHLVAQFSTLASRLGISLPQNVLSSLTQQVISKEASKVNGETPSPKKGFLKDHPATMGLPSPQSRQDNNYSIPVIPRLLQYKNLENAAQLKLRKM